MKTKREIEDKIKELVKEECNFSDGYESMGQCYSYSPTTTKLTLTDFVEWIFKKEKK